MDSEHKHRVISSFNLPNLGIIVELSDVEFGFKKGMVFKSITSKLYWEVQSRIINSSNEKRFDGETETVCHYNIREVGNLKNRNELFNYFQYNIKPIGHNEKPNSGDFLVFTVTVAVRVIYKVIDIYDDYLLLDTNNGNTGVLHKKYVADKVRIGDYVRHCEHRIHDLVDEFGNFIYRE
jgi:hypothetical protein